jgi:hypothetical protein
VQQHAYPINSSLEHGGAGIEALGSAEPSEIYLFLIELVLQDCLLVEEYTISNIADP